MTLRPHRMIAALSMILACGALSAQARSDQRPSQDRSTLHPSSIPMETIRPEVLMLLDLSGSMAMMVEHPAFAPHPPVDEVAPGFRFELRGAGQKDAEGRLIPPGRFSTVASYQSKTLTLTNGMLIRPDGSILREDEINRNYWKSNPLLGGEDSVPLTGDVRNWIRCASHIRFTYNGRTYDLPIAWTVLDRPDTTPDPTNPDASKRTYHQMFNTYPLRMEIINPATGNTLEIDSAYRVMSQKTSDGMYSMFVEARLTGNRMTSCRLAGTSEAASFAGWRPSYMAWIFQGNHAIPQVTSFQGRAFENGIPAYTRAQALKDAVMQTWARHHNRVFLAYRFLKYWGPEVGSRRMVVDPSMYPSNDSRNDLPLGDPTKSPVLASAQRGWVLVNDSSTSPRSDEALRRLAHYVAGGGTPLASALVNTYAQLNDPNCIFNEVERGDDRPSEAQKSYVMLFTDGLPNSEQPDPLSIQSPYIADFAGSAAAGNVVFTADRSRLFPTSGSRFFNIINLAAQAAHGGDPANAGMMVPVYPSGTQTYPIEGSRLESWMPFWVRERGNGVDKVVFETPRPITTMFMGISLGGWLMDKQGPKYRLFAASACADPDRKAWDLSTLRPFTPVNPLDPTQGKTPDSTYFFDVDDPSTLAQTLNAAFLMMQPPAMNPPAPHRLATPCP